MMLASEGRLLLFVQTRTMHILSTWTASDYIQRCTVPHCLLYWPL